MAVRPRHPNKELEALLQEGEDLGWTVTKGRRYFKMKCPCGVHMKTVHLSPSDPNYERNLRGWLTRTGCWKEDHR